jgi:TonB family protein
MPENILVVEYEPRYADRVRTALTGSPFHAEYAKDGEEAMRALDTYEPKLIVLSSVVPKISAPDLIRIIRGRAALQKTPILITVSGYTGTAPKQDAVRMGASDLLAKPYSEAEFLSKVQQLLGVGQMTSNEIFGDILEDSAIAHPKKGPKANEDVDEMLERTLAGVMPKKRDPLKAKTTSPGTTELDKRFQDTLSGLEKNARASARPHTSPGAVAVPQIPPPPVAAPPPPAPVPPPAKEEEGEPTDGIRFGQYVLLEKIATGGMAEVWKARMRGAEGFQKIVAIKKILPHLSDNQEFIEMFVDEAKLAAQLNHNNIVHIYDLDKVGDSYYIAMEYVDGHDLKNILKQAHERGQPMTVEVALFITAKIASALDYAHRKRDFDEKDLSLVHRDVSPQNVLISQEGDIKLCDFGIAKAASKASHTQVGALKGKLQYMSPEQASGKLIDKRSDIFALGTVLFEMLTSRKLFTGENEISILEQVREARVVPPSQFNDEVTADIDRVVFKTLQKDPAARYQTAGDMARDIDAILYNFKPTPTSADLAIYMHHIWSAEAPAPRLEQQPERAPEPPVRDSSDLAAVAPPPRVASAPPPVARAVTSPGLAMPSWEAPPSAKKKSPIVPLSIAAVLVAAIVGGFLFVRARSSGPGASPGTVSNAPVATPKPVTTRTDVGVTGATTATTATTTQPAAGGAQPSLDPDLVNQEVQKRLAAERARLEQRTGGTQPAPPLTARNPAPAIVTRTAPPPVQQPPVTQPVTQTVAPPVVQTTASTPPTATTTQATNTTQTTAPPPPPPVTETVARVREGDLIAAGTDGLVPARVLRRGTVPYPPMARAQRVEATIICSVLVSETGQVLDVRVLRGTERGGLNEAAMQIMRRSTFSPPTKDGVRVKAWTTVPVDFKL